MKMFIDVGTIFRLGSKN